MPPIFFHNEVFEQKLGVIGLTKSDKIHTRSSFTIFCPFLFRDHVLCVTVLREYFTMPLFNKSIKSTILGHDSPFLKKTLCLSVPQHSLTKRLLRSVLFYQNFLLKALLEWCEFNTLDINWSKTFFMFVTNKRVKLPKEINISSKIVK